MREDITRMAWALLNLYVEEEIQKNEAVNILKIIDRISRDNSIPLPIEAVEINKLLGNPINMTEL